MVSKREKILVANRGEIACRIIRSAEFMGISTVAVYSEVDVSAPHVQIADEAALLGPAHPAQSYLNQQKIIEIALEHEVTMIHPGYGFLAENAEFAEACEDAGIRFIGPKPKTIRDMGDKERARNLAVAAGVPVLPGSKKLGNHSEEIHREAAAVGYPLLVKASAGGGGIGMRIVETPDGLLEAIESTRALAQKAFGDDAVFLERYISKARHIEIQVFGFGERGAVHLYERDCSLQRRHQKVIEEAPAPLLDETIRLQIAEVAKDLALACSYEGAGTVEFLYDEASNDFFFLEMNTRIQVEHPVTEMITGVDLVRAQILYAIDPLLAINFLSEGICIYGHAIEARIYAERPEKNFIPSPGTISKLTLPELQNVRVECGVVEGQKITPFYDPMLMKVIALGEDREKARLTLLAALSQLKIEGIKTNIDFITALLENSAIVDGRVYTLFISDNINSLVNK